MNTLDLSQSVFSLLPPLVALILAIFTRRVLLSLGAGIVLGALLLADFQWLKTCTYLYDTLSGLVYGEDGFNLWNLSIVFFLLLLGMMTALLTLSGGTQAFANWAERKIQTPQQARLLTVLLGGIIFIDDYFNSLAVGAIARPVTDRFKIARSKLAYLLDSTAAPMCVLMPVSSWGAYIITVIGGILTVHGINEYTPLSAFVQLAGMNFYALFALLMVTLVAWRAWDVGSMKHHELMAQSNRLDDEGDDLPEAHELNEELDIESSKNGRVRDLVLPITGLVVATASFLVLTGAQALQAEGSPFSWIGAFENTNVGNSLCYGGLIGVALALWANVRQKVGFTPIRQATWTGCRSMLGAILILFSAWAMGGVIGDLKTGTYLSSLIQGQFDPAWLPVMLFILSGIMAFSTGTSWGTFGIMLPIAGDLAAASEMQLMLPMLAAVLAGAVFGDHCSPISDTTILSSTGARCDHIDHVTTQLPYAIGVACVAAVGFLVLGFTQSIWLAWAGAFMAFGVVSLLFSRWSNCAFAETAKA